MSLNFIKNEYKRVMEMDIVPSKRAYLLSQLMSDLEREYNVLVLKKDLTPEIEKSEEYRLYLEISNSRS